MNGRLVRLNETFDAIGGPLARLGRSLREDGDAIARAEADKSSHDQLATDAFLQRFQQVTDLVLRKLFPRLLAVSESSDMRHGFGAVLDHLDGYEVIADVPWWIELNETRNRLIQDYAMSVEDRAAEIGKAWIPAIKLRAEVDRIRQDGAVSERLSRQD